MKPRAKIHTNNPDVSNAYPLAALFFDVDVFGILVMVRDLVHMGARLITHPMAGSIYLNKNPYRSIMYCMGSGICESSLYYIEAAIDSCLRKGHWDHTEQALADFRAIDLDLMRNAFEGGVLYERDI